MHVVVRSFGLLLIAVAAIATARAQSDPKTETKKEAPMSDKAVFRNVSAPKLEAILKEMKIDADKVKGKTEGINFYDFVRGDYKVRLHNYQGKDLWIDAHFSDKLSLDEINKWNVRAKFSRAVMLKGDKGSVSLEAQLDCVGGVTDGIVRQFIERFDGELAQFTKFINK